ncbi:hypothetical protein [Pseudomonas sp. GM60]|uniref:hypothetical protein n=1 Tax=Pseudomonas sp. GM60 TaxID=1144334 RepID=UPI001EE66F44|nr:hypothetical protein [Pseudomonas sp. GM60]
MNVLFACLGLALVPDYLLGVTYASQKAESRASLGSVFRVFLPVDYWHGAVRIEASVGFE